MIEYLLDMRYRNINNEELEKRLFEDFGPYAVEEFKNYGRLTLNRAFKLRDEFLKDHIDNIPMARTNNLELFGEYVPCYEGELIGWVNNDTKGS